MTEPLATFPDLRDAAVFITGGGSGIGAALTEAFLEQGARVAFVGRSDAGAFVEEMAAKHAQRPLFIPCDITDVAALHAAMDAAAAAHGPLRVLVNNAANDTRYAASDVTEAVWDQMQAVNLKAYFFACQRAAAQMQASGLGGSIINFSSISYMMGIAGLSTYISANAGIMGLTRSLAREWGPDRIRVNAVAPGWVLTERQRRLWATPEALSAHVDKQCLKDVMEPRDIAGTVLFLASNLSRMMTGQSLVIDAGVVGTG
ncbi:MAG: SDR family oxidoreductase [Rhodobacterales bacterium]|nr:SDR family oxidoreductase [Rhodobacterales bacterium]NCT11938.1 SDR family oxidoreductase [Rhodobacterales bacterium]